MIVRVLVLMCASWSAALRILPWPPLNCSQQGLQCAVSKSNCMHGDMLNINKYTPSSPEDLQVSVGTREDETGHLQPVLLANWKIRDDGSIGYLKATELHVLVLSTNLNVCIRYSFEEQLPMRSPTGEKWSFSANMLAVDPGQSYRVSVFNIPKPELNHSDYDVSANVIIPDCQEQTMKWTQFCIERGSLWQPNITVAQLFRADGRSVLTVGFTPDTRCDKYIVIVHCSSSHHITHAYKTNVTELRVTVNLDYLDIWPRSCCQFVVEIKPIFFQCGQDCTRQRQTLDICDEIPPAPTIPVYPFVILGVIFTFLVTALIVYCICRKPVSGTPGVVAAPEGGGHLWQRQLKQTPKVLVIYSLDHSLYRDIVLKLCAFLQAKCGTMVLLDLLDSNSVGMVGPLRWLELQLHKLEDPFDKILVLCSRGVQAKWRAICGQGRVTLREDVLSPTDEILTPFLNRLVLDIQQAGMMGKYMVAYFEDISTEHDVPSVFDIAVKYKLMKHFEELYFRILDEEKYQPGQVNHIEGISGDEYFNCPTGEALKNAIETFKAFQLENPDWFEKECVESEEEVMTKASIPITQLQIPPVLECVPVIRDGPPVYTHEVEINKNVSSVCVLTPELNKDRELLPVAELTPVIHQHSSNLQKVLTDHIYPHSPVPGSINRDASVLMKLPPNRQTWRFLNEDSVRQIPIENEEDEPLLPVSQLAMNSDQSVTPQNSLDSDSQKYLGGVKTEYFPLSKIRHDQPVNVDECVVLEPNRKGQSSGSDQGYISKLSSQEGQPSKEDPLLALKRLQEELLQRNLRYYGIDCEEN